MNARENGLCPITQEAEGVGLENREVVMSGAGVRIFSRAF